MEMLGFEASLDHARSGASNQRRAVDQQDRQGILRLIQGTRSSAVIQKR